MKQSSQKIPRGQMVYAPINSSQQRQSKSPFSSNKKILIGTKSQQNFAQQQTKSIRKNVQLATPQSFYLPQRQNRSQSPIHNDPSLLTNPYSYHEYQQKLRNLIKQNQLLKSRQDIYISKLMKLQQGLQKQHEQFMNLQQLYEQLFNGYKQKQQQVSELQTKYKQTERSKSKNQYNTMRNQYNTNKNQYNTNKNQFNNTNAKINTSFSDIQKMNSIKNTIYEQNLKNQIALLIFQNKRLNQTNQKLLSQLNYIKSKDKLQQSRKGLEQKVFDELTDYQKIIDGEKQQKIKLEYENKFFKMRIEDLEKNILDLQKTISLKQTQIIKMRQQKMHIRRQSSEKVLNRSPPRANNIDSSRTKTNQQQNKKLVQLIQNLQIQNQRLRQQNITLKQKSRLSTQSKHNSRISQTAFTQIHNRAPSIHRKLEYDAQNDRNYQQKFQNSLRSYQNQNYNSQNTNQQYFSFSRQKEDKQSQQSDLPTFPMDLQIEGIIKKHTDNNGKQIQQSAVISKVK